MVIARGEITITEVYDGDRFYRAWADSSDGRDNFSTTESDRLYLGVFSGLEAPTHYSQYSWTRLKGDSGENAVFGILSNESHQIGTDENGNNGNYFGAETSMIILEGGRNDNPNWEIDTISIDPVNGATGRLVDGFTYIVDEDSMTEDQVNITLKATHKEGIHSPIEKVFKLTKSKQGISGNHAESFFLIFNDTTIKKNRVTEQMIPEELTIQGNSILGDGAPVLREGFFKIYEQAEFPIGRDEYEQYYEEGLLDKDELYVLSEESYPLVLSYTSMVAETTLTYNYSDIKDLTSIRVYWYKDAEFEELLDVQTIIITSDGIDGEDSILLVLETPEGTTIRNSEGTISIKSELYKGSVQVTPTEYKWYKRLPGANGDLDSGSGWSRLTNTTNYGTSGYDTGLLTVPPQAIKGHETFMAIITYEGKTYRNHVNIDDITDPYIISVLGDSFFKNGQGTNTYLAKIYQGGQEIDLAGNFTYTWHQYSSTGSKIVGFEKVGKEITVTSDEFSGKGELRVTVTK